MKEIHITLSTDFVMKNFSGGKVPTNLIRDALADVEALSVVQKNPYELIVYVKDQTSPYASLDGIRSIVAGELTKQYSVSAEEVNRIVDYQISEREEKPAEQTDRKSEVNADQPEMPEQAGQAAEKVMERIRAMKGAEEFRALAEELHQMAPILKNSKAESVLVRRSYLFSIDPGFGLTYSLNAMADLLREDGVFQIKGEAKEYKLDAPAGNRNVLGEAAEQVSMMENKVVCFDISNWSDQVATPEFRDFLSQIHRRSDKLIYVFRVPYLEKNTLNRISYALNDVMTVKAVTFVPLETRLLSQIAQEKLAEYGFSASEDAIARFEQRLADEKSDGRFYGIQTCIKVVSEMIYDKLRTIVGNPDAGNLSEEEKKIIR
ncbi:MAG: hypothetical protein J6M46_05265, partial [Lachnospiraceae bacterium]|nr:hypothetical protein [Lachnospiraceae bacterium]